MRRYFRNYGGFTLLELIVSIALVGMLSAVAVPSVITHINYTESVGCGENRKVIIREYAVQSVLDPSLTTAELLAGRGKICPGGGVITGEIIDGRLYLTCSIHGTSLGSGGEGSSSEDE